MKKLFSPAVRKLFLTVLTQGIILGLSVIAGFLLPGKMGPDNFGYWQIYLFYLTYLNLFGLGFNDGIALFYGGYYYKDLPFEKLRSAMKITCLFQFLLCVLGIGAVYLFVPAGIYRIIYLALVLNIPLTCLQCIILTTFLSVGKTELYNVINLILKVLTVGFYLCILAFGYRTAPGMILMDTLARLLITLVCFILGKDLLFGKCAPFSEGLKELVEKSKAGFFITLAIISSMLMPVLGRSVVEHCEPIGVYGIYSFAMSLLTIILSFTNVLGSVIFPLIKRMDEGEMTNSYSRFATICDTFVVLALFLYLPLMFIVNAFLPKYLPALDYLHFLLVMCIPLGRAQLLVTPFYKAKRYEKQLFVANVVGVLAMFVVLYGAYFLFESVVAVAIGSTVILTLWTFAAELYLNRETGLTPIIKKTLLQVITMTLFCIAGSFRAYLPFTIIYSLTVLLYLFFVRKDLLVLGKAYLKK